MQHWILVSENLFLIFRFSLVQKTGLPCTALCFNLHETNEILVALADYSLRCYNTGKQPLQHLSLENQNIGLQ